MTVFLFADNQAEAADLRDSKTQGEETRLNTAVVSPNLPCAINSMLRTVLGLGGCCFYSLLGLFGS